MTDIAKIDYSILDRPEVLQFLFHPRPELSPYAFQATDSASLHPDEKDILIVNSGKVKFSDSDDENNKVLLIKGEKAELDVSSRLISKSINNDPNYLSWKTGKLTFENETFDKNKFSLFMINEIVYNY